MRHVFVKRSQKRAVGITAELYSCNSFGTTQNITAHKTSTMNKNAKNMDVTWRVEREAASPRPKALSAAAVG